ncbi:MAG: Ger(x)C family spore germination protein [Oscillospiraceae bacterium]|nr:Ger(x)C family spore germination protein [Oscillospiraceae bacterium]MDD4413671.1 Ger(x)C family spore germination protein [Oscillospiraceae bacterium]
MKAKALFVLLILLLFPLLSSCSVRELNTISLVTALGIDKDEAGYMVTYQTLNAKAVASKKSVNESSFFLYTEKGNDLGEIERRTTTQAARKMYFEHVRSVVIGEDVARDGLKEILDYLFRTNEFRSDFYFIIAKGTTANQILSTVTPIQSISGIQLFESIDNSKIWWAPTNSLKTVELINDINAKGKSPALAGVELYQEAEDMATIEKLKDSNPGKLKLTALGAFHNDKLIGWLDESESLALNSITGKVKNSAASVDYDENTHVSLAIKFWKTKIKVSLSDGKPVVNVILSAEMSITTVAGDVDFTDQKKLNKLNSITNKKIIGICKKTLGKAQNELKTDIFGFGESIHRAYPKVWNKLKDDWDTEFTKLQVNFMVDTIIMDMGQNLKSIINEEE